MTKTKQLTREIFCAKDQERTDHLLTLSSNGAEVVCTCQAITEVAVDKSKKYPTGIREEICGRVIKFPASNPKQFAKLIEKHEEANQGQVTQEALDAKLAEIVGDPGEE